MKLNTIRPTAHRRRVDDVQSLQQIISKYGKISHVPSRFQKRSVKPIVGYHKFSSPSCVKHLKRGVVYLWNMRKAVFTVCIRFGKRSDGSKHTDLSDKKKCQAAGEIKVTKHGVFFNMRTGSYKFYDQRADKVILEYLEQQSKPVFMRPYWKGLLDDPDVKYKGKPSLSK